MDHSRSTSGNGEDTGGIPEDLRCKRSDGKQWRCSAMSMPDKTVCEKHYIQAKKRAANSALRASLKKAKRKSYGDTDDYLDSRSDEVDPLFSDMKAVEMSASFSGKKDSFLKNQARYSPETPTRRSLSTHSPLMLNDEGMRDIAQLGENRKSPYRTPPHSSRESLRNKTQNFNNSPPVEEEDTDESTDSSEEEGGLTCHQCQRNDTDRVIWCLKCDKRGYCDTCISKWYPGVSLEEVQKACPVCRGTCNCNLCLHGDNLIKFRIRDITASDKLQYFHCLLSSIFPVIKRIHHDQCFELDLETRLHARPDCKVNIPRAKLHADEQMCCNFCRMPIIDYHRHCANCLYDLCLICCRDLRQASQVIVKGELLQSSDGDTAMKQQRISDRRMNIAEHSPDWRANTDGSIPCPPKGADGCGSSFLMLRRIFKMNWVAKLVKSVQEMVDGCKLYDVDSTECSGLSNGKFCQFSQREETNDNFLYCPLSEDFKQEGIYHFQKHWARGEPIVVKQVFDSTMSSNWHPMVIWRGIRDTTDEKTKDDNRIVKAIDCLDGSEVDIELGQFIKGYTEGRIHESGWPEMLKLKDWPSPGASEEFLQYQRPELLSKLPIIEYIHYKWGILNVAAKLPHYSMQNDVGPKIYVAYGTYEELGRGDSVTNLHTNTRDMVYVLMHTFEVQMKGWQRTKIEKLQKCFREPDANDSHEKAQVTFTDEGGRLFATELDNSNCRELGLNINEDALMDDQVCDTAEGSCGKDQKKDDSEPLGRDGADLPNKTKAGAVWDVFRRQDVPNLIKYLSANWKDLKNPSSVPMESEMYPLFDQLIYLDVDHKNKLKENFGIEPWTFEQHLGEAVFIPAGCPFQARNLQSSVQLALDFLSPESLEESVRLGEEIRCLPSNHKAKCQMLEVGKMSLYAASSAIKDVEKLVLDPKTGRELGLGDPNLTASVSENLEKMSKRRQIACT